MVVAEAGGATRSNRSIARRSQDRYGMWPDEEPVQFLHLHRGSNGGQGFPGPLHLRHGLVMVRA